MRSSIIRRSVFTRPLAALGAVLLLLAAMPVHAQDGEDAAEGTTEKVAVLKTNMGAPGRRPGA